MKIVVPIMPTSLEEAQELDRKIKVRIENKI